MDIAIVNSVINSTELVPLLEAWLAKKRGIKSEKTRVTYTSYIKDFLAFTKISSLEELTVKLVIDYKAYLIEQNNAPATIKTKLGTVRSFYSFLHTINLFGEKELKMVREFGNFDGVGKRARVDRSCTREDIEAVLNLAAQKSPRDYWMYRTIAALGLRASEVAGLRIEDIRGDRLMVLGKGNKWRELVLSPNLLNGLRTFLGDRQNGYIFLSFSGKKLTNRDVHRRLKGYVTELGLNIAISPHWLRHFFARDSLKHGVDLYKVSSALGHASIDLTRKTYGDFAADTSFSSFS